RRALTDAFDDTEVTFDGRPQDIESVPVIGAVVGVERLLEALEFNHDDALFQSGLAGFDLVGGTNDELPARSVEHLNRKSPVRFECGLVGNRAITHDPITLLHISSFRAFAGTRSDPSSRPAQDSGRTDGRESTALCHRTP